MLQGTEPAAKLYDQIREIKKSASRKDAEVLEGLGWDQFGFPATHVKNFFKKHFHGDGETLVSKLVPDFLKDTARSKFGVGQNPENQRRFKAFMVEIENIYNVRASDEQGQVSAIKDLFESKAYEADRTKKDPGAPASEYEKAYNLVKLAFSIHYQKQLQQLADPSSQDKPVPYVPEFRVEQFGKADNKELPKPKERSAAQLTGKSLSSITSSSSSSSSSSSTGVTATEDTELRVMGPGKTYGSTAS